MSLTIRTEMASQKQLSWLKKHNYYGSLQLTKQAATQLIGEYMEQERIGINNNQKLFVERLNDFDPWYLENYKQFKKGIA